MEHKDDIIGKDLIPLYEFNVGNAFDIIPADTVSNLGLNLYSMQCASNDNVLIMCPNTTGYTRITTNYSYEYFKYTDVEEFTSHIGSNSITKRYVTDIDGTICLALSTNYTTFLFQSIDGKNWTYLTSISDTGNVELITKINDEYFIGIGSKMYYSSSLTSITEYSSIPTIYYSAYDNSAIYIYQFSSRRVYKYDCTTKTYSQILTEYSEYTIEGGFSIDGYAILPAFRSSDNYSTNLILHNGAYKTNVRLPQVEVNTGMKISCLMQYCGKIGNTYVLFGESHNTSGGIATSITYTTDFNKFSSNRYISMQSSYYCNNQRAASFNNAIIIPGTTFYRPNATTNDQTFAMITMLSYRPGMGSRFVVSGVAYAYSSSTRHVNIYCNTNNVSRLDVVVKLTTNHTYVLTVTPNDTEAAFFVTPDTTKYMMTTYWYEDYISLSFSGAYTMNRVINYTLYYETP